MLNHAIEKPMILVCNEVCCDGVGDFEHFRNIVKQLISQEHLADYQIFGLVIYQKRPQDTTSAHYDPRNPQLPHTTAMVNRFHQVCSGLRHTNEAFDYKIIQSNSKESKSTEVHSLFARAQQILFVSYGPCFGQYANDIPETTVLKHIREHECLSPVTSFPRHQNLVRSLGLTEGCYGLLLDQKTPFSEEEKMQILNREDPAFVAALLSSFGKTTLEDFFHEYLCVPAYYNDFNRFSIFVHFLLQNPTILGGKKLCIYQSGMSSDDLQNELELVISDRAQCRIVTSSDDQLVTKPGNDLHFDSPNLTILTGFRVSDQSYQSLIEQAGIFGVSGDRSFETAIFSGVLPFYLSTNRKECRTLPALRAILQQESLQITPEARQAFICYFDEKRMSQYQSDFFLDDSKINPFQDVNFAAMKENWPIVVQFLRENYNFYDKINAIIEEKYIPKHDLPSQDPVQYDIRPNKSSIFHRCYDQLSSVVSYFQKTP